MKLLSINYAFNSGLGFMGNRKKEDIILPLQDPTICLESPTTGSHNAYSRLWKVPACFMFVHMFQGSLECHQHSHQSVCQVSDLISCLCTFTTAITISMFPPHYSVIFFFTFFLPFLFFPLASPWSL